jgi:metallophosphoesterase (TIGR00282 family)
MRVLYVGDIMGEPGINALAMVLPELKKTEAIDIVIAQAENTSAGRGITPKDFMRLQEIGVDFCSGGNHTFDSKLIYPQLESDFEPIIRPANYPVGTPGKGHKLLHKNGKTLLIASLLGHVVGKDSKLVLDNPLKVIDAILEHYKLTKRDATIVNFHGDFSSEKVVIGQYLDGRVTAVIGDHWHIPTADARLLPGGTAHITDVGMVGALNSSLGVKTDNIISRWRDGTHNKNELETAGPRQFNAVLVDSDVATGLATAIIQIQRTLY